MFLRREHLTALVVAVSLAASAEPSYAQVDMWQVDGVPLCTFGSDQLYPTIVTDGAGGAFVTWQDGRTSVSEIYAQHVLASGAVDPAWPVDGLALCTAAGGQLTPTIVTDGAGGAIVTWEDGRNPFTTYSDIYAQRVNAAGVVQWTPDGVALCTAAGYQYTPRIVTDMANGAIVTWYDGGGNIYAQRVNDAGVVQWTPNGVALCTAAGNQLYPTIVTDGAGGAIVTWVDGRNPSPSYSDIYAQRVNAAGMVQWTANGVALCAALGYQSTPTIVTDEAGGAIVTWMDGRNPSPSYSDIYAQRVNDAGVVQWTPDGVVLCAAAGAQSTPTIVTDMANGAIVTWQDQRSGYHIYAQRVNDAGVVQWTPDGVALCPVGSQQYPTIVTDGANGAIVTWYDTRAGNDIYAQHVLASGAVDPAWTAANGNANGSPLCKAANVQNFPTIVTDMAGGAIVTWEDYRSNVSYDIYAQRVSGSGGTTAISVALQDATAEVGLVRLRWNVPDERGVCTVQRRTAGSDWSELGLAAFERPGVVAYEDRSVSSGERYAYRLFVQTANDQGYSGEVWVLVPNERGAPQALRLDPVYPNPFETQTRLNFGTPSAGKIRLAIFDVAGRHVATVLDREVPMGWRSVAWDGRDTSGSPVASGTYFARLESAGRVEIRKIVVAR